MDAVNRTKTRSCHWKESIFRSLAPGRVNKGTPQQNFKQKGKYEVFEACGLGVSGLPGLLALFWPRGLPGPDPGSDRAGKRRCSDCCPYRTANRGTPRAAKGKRLCCLAHPASGAAWPPATPTQMRRLVPWFISV